MDFYNFFKGFFGIPNSVPPQDFYKYKDFDAQIDTHNEDFHDSEDAQGFAMFTNPHEMQEYFERHINQLMKSFGMTLLPDTPGSSAFFSDFFNSSALPEGKYPEGHSAPSLREQYLKPGFDEPTSHKTDKDMDGKVDINELDSLLKQPKEDEPTMGVTPYTRPSLLPKRPHFYGRNMTSKTVVHSDGSVETSTTVRDNEGNQETTVTRKNRDGEYTIVTKRDKDGKEEREERFIGNHAAGPQVQDERNLPPIVGKFDGDEDGANNWWSNLFNRNK